MSGRPVWAEVNLDAVRHNVRQLVALAGPAELCAVVKADGYGHGAVPVARAAVEAGASWLAVALVSEGKELRSAGIREPILLLSEPAHDEMLDAVVHGLRPAVYTPEGIEAAAKAVSMTGSAPLPVHLKVDTGMHRVGASADEVLDRAMPITERSELDLEGIWTHCAVADEPDHPFTDEQLDRFEVIVDRLGAEGIRPRVRHAANSAALLAGKNRDFDLVRAGIAVYGLSPAPQLTGVVPLRPALSLVARVSFVKQVAAGEGVSYGLRHRPAADSLIATVPIGYADGVRRQLALSGGSVLIRGRRRPLAGVVTMDQLMVDCGQVDDRRSHVEVGDEVVLLGRQGAEEITASDWAEQLGTISYEVVCGLSSRVPRTHVDPTRRR